MDMTRATNGQNLLISCRGVGYFLVAEGGDDARIVRCDDSGWTRRLSDDGLVCAGALRRDSHELAGGWPLILH
jgi:hypothetical protein